MFTGVRSSRAAETNSSGTAEAFAHDVARAEPGGKTFMSRSAWDEVARLRGELAAAWEAVERTEGASYAGRSDQRLADAQAALRQWRRTSTAMYNAIDECLKRDSGRQPQVSRAGNNCASDSAPGSENATTTGEFDSPPHGVDLASQATWQPCCISQHSAQMGEPTQSLPTPRVNLPGGGRRVRWNLGQAGLHYAGCLQVSTSA